MLSPFVELLADLAGALDEVGAGWYLFGAQAALIHGAARLTEELFLERAEIRDLDGVNDSLLAIKPVRLKHLHHTSELPRAAGLRPS
ncbi:MAG: hypothetical protein ACMG6S_18450, partial [Byssovorax sp.]